LIPRTIVRSGAGFFSAAHHSREIDSVVVFEPVGSSGVVMKASTVLSFASIVASTLAFAPLMTACAAQEVRCEGINTCEGTSECKSSDGTNDCKGMNSCEGQGWIYSPSSDECTTAGGVVI
jgi:hypothetical protein